MTDSDEVTWLKNTILMYPDVIRTLRNLYFSYKNYNFVWKLKSGSNETNSVFETMIMNQNFMIFWDFCSVLDLINAEIIN